MPLPDLNAFCVKLSVPAELCVRLPGGAAICARFPDGKIPTQGELTSALLAQVNTGLAPLTPFFDVLDVIQAMVNCIKAVEKCLGPPPDPTELIKCFPELGKALGKLLQLIPQLSVPVLIADVLDVIIAYLKGVRAQLLAFIRKQVRILAAEAYVRELGSIQLQTAIDCATDDLHVAIRNLNQGASALGQLVEVVNALLSLAGLPELPLGVGQLGADAESSLAPLDATLELLTGIRAGFP